MSVCLSVSPVTDWRPVQGVTPSHGPTTMTLNWIVSVVTLSYHPVLDCQ